MISITSDFECGNGKNVEQLSENHFRLEVEGDKQSGYGSYFCFDVINDGPAADVTVDLHEDPKFGGPTNFGAVFPTTIWIKEHGFHRFRPLQDSQARLTEGCCTFRVPVGEGGRLRVAMTYVAPYSEVSDMLRGLAEGRRDRCELITLGTSVRGTDILVLRAGTPGSPKVLCIAGQHAHEHAAVWGVCGVADFMSSLVPEAEALREALEVYAAPVVNPDGNAAGANAFNAEGLDMYTAFGGDPDAPEPEAHESRLLWSWALEMQPALWMNFHSYTGWKLNSEHPYDGWYEVADRGVFSQPGQRLLYDALCDTVRLETDAPSTHERASIHPESTLCHQLASRCDIPHVFYEINNATAGKHGGSKRALHVFRKAARTLLHYVS